MLTPCCGCQFNPVEGFIRSVKSECRRQGDTIINSGDRAACISSIIHTKGRAGILQGIFHHAGWNTEQPLERGLELLDD